MSINIKTFWAVVWEHLGSKPGSCTTVNVGDGLTHWTDGKH